MIPFQTILCPTDFSEGSRSAFQLACSLAGVHGAKIILAHVNDALYGKQTYGGYVVEVRPEDYPEQLKEQLNQFQSPYPNVEIERVVVEGEPVENVLRLAEDRHCDVIVMGTHGRTGLLHLLLGSVAEKVLRQAPCPVITVRVGEQHSTEKLEEAKRIVSQRVK